MPNKQLTQTGLNRAMWIMLKKLGGKINIPGRLLEMPNPNDAMQVQYDPGSDSFTLSLHKVKEQKQSIIIQQGNLN